MSAFNVYNHGAVEAYLKGFSEGHERVGELLTRLMRKPLLKHGAAMKVVEGMPADVPEILRDKWKSAPVWHAFDPTQDAELGKKVTKVAAWLKNAIDTGADWLTETGADGKTPKRISAVGSTLDQVMALVENAEIRDKSKRVSHIFAGKAVNPNLNDADIVLGNGYYIKALTTPAHLDEESEALVHCAGNGTHDEKLLSGESLFFSLRDPMGNPCVTMEVDAATGTIVECQGKELAVPRPKYVPMIMEFIDRMNFRLDPAYPQATGILLQGESAFSMYSLPDGIVHEGDLDFSRIKGARMPNGAKVRGNLILNAAEHPEIPEGIEIGRDVVFLRRDEDHKHHSSADGPGLLKVDPRTGITLTVQNYTHGLLDGEEKIYDRLGRLERASVYNRGDRVSITTYDTATREVQEHYVYVDGRAVRSEKPVALSV